MGLRGLLILLLLLSISWLAAWGAASALAPGLARRALPRVVAQVEELDVGLSEVEFGAIRISPGLTRAGLEDFRARFDLDLRNRIQLQSRADVRELQVWLDRPWALRGSVRATGLDVYLDPSDLPRSVPFDRFANAELVVGDLPLARPRQVVQQLRAKLTELFLENKAVGDVNFTGEVELTVNGEVMTARLYTERVGERFRLRFDESDIQALCDRKGMGLAPEQVAIVSLYPIRLPVIMKVTEQARFRARVNEPGDFWLRDAHRHVTWSFLLTEHFGPEFAAKVTDAQEMRPGNTPSERAMDFHNNAIGRKLSAEGVELASLPERVRDDPNIIRHPDEVDTFGEERLLR
jgi:hypothetical protein